MSITEYWQRYSEQYNARPLRERALIFVCIIAAIYVVWDFGFYQRVSGEQKQLTDRYQKASQKLEVLTSQEKALINALSANPLLKKQQEITQLKNRLKAIDQQIEDLSIGLIAPDKLPLVIRELIVNLDKIDLLGLRTLAPEPFQLPSDKPLGTDDLVRATGRADPEPNDEVDQIGVFKHRVVFRIRGRYLDIMDYLADLENGQWYFYWSELQYVVEGYPQALVQLEAYTLSTGRGFIGE